MADHFLKRLFLKKKNRIVLIEIIGLFFFIFSGFLPYKIHAYFGTYKIGFSLISFYLILVTILISFSVVSIYYENYLSAMLISVIGCSIAGVILITDLASITSQYPSEYLGIGFYFAYFPWLCFCIVSIFLFKSRIILPQSSLYKTLNEYEIDHLSELKGLYLFSLIVFYILISLPFEFGYSHGAFFYGTGVYFFILGGGWIGVALLVISYIYLYIFQIQKSVIIGLIGNFIIGINLIVIFLSAELVSPDLLSAAYLMSILFWIFIFYVNVAQLIFLFRKYGSPKKDLIKLNWNKPEVNSLKWVNVFYLICTIGFIITTLFPYSPYSHAYDLSKVGLHYLWMGGWQGLFLIILSIIFLYFLQIRIAYTLGIFGSIWIGINFIILLNSVFVDDQQTFFINFYMSVSLLAILFLTNILLLLFHLKYKGFFRIRKKFSNNLLVIDKNKIKLNSKKNEKER